MPLEFTLKTRKNTYETTKSDYYSRETDFLVTVFYIFELSEYILPSPPKCLKFPLCI